MLTMILDFLKSIGAAYKAARADRAAEDVAATKPLVDHADVVVEGITAEIRKAGGVVGGSGSGASGLPGMLPN